MIKEVKMRIKDTKTFIEKAKEVHGNKYDYSKSIYVDKKTKICIICPKHGEFWQTAHQHVNMKCGCAKCSREKRATPKITTEEWITRAKSVHGDKYDYSKSKYVNQNKKLCIICPEHGEFWQTPTAHTFLKEGCPKCSGKYRMTTEDWVEKAKKIHGDKYDYSKVLFKNAFEKVCIICPEHGEFWQAAHSHLEGYGCKKCAAKARQKKYSKGKERFVEEARKIHGDRYDYSKVDYKNANTKVCIICPEHGEFWQTPIGHLSNYQGCPFCKTRSKMELALKELFEKNNIEYVHEKKFDWLKYYDNLRIDFFLPQYNLAIECQGEQHFKAIELYGGEERFVFTQTRDNIKYEKCKKHNIKMLYIVQKKCKKYLKEEEKYKNVVFYEDIKKDNNINLIIKK